MCGAEARVSWVCERRDERGLEEKGRGGESDGVRRTIR